MKTYTEFLSSKRLVVPPGGFLVDEEDINPQLFPFQRNIVRWALARGKAAVFANTGLGKTAMQLCWAQHVCQQTGGNVLILAPLAVTQQTLREAEHFGITKHVEVTSCRTAKDVRRGISITNYEMLHHFIPEAFAGIVADESSILKAFDGKTKQQIIDFSSSLPYRLACTATPAPNDTAELLNHAEFLGIMTRKEILAYFFKQDGNSSSVWRLRHHAVHDFWRWLATWAVACRLPSDLAFPDDGYILPRLTHHHHTIRTDPKDRTTLLPMEAHAMGERLRARQQSVGLRATACADLVNASEETWIVWCHLNTEADALQALIPEAVEVRGSDSLAVKEQRLTDFAAGKFRVLISKPSICGWGLNWQHCHNVAFVGLTDSFEEVYQSIRRCWRFGQQSPVEAHFFSADTEGAVVRNIQRKELEMTHMLSELVQHMKGQNLQAAIRGEAQYTENIWTGPGWCIRQGDNIELMDTVDDDSIGLALTSCPFPGMYLYSNSPRDMGNAQGIPEMINHFRYLVGHGKLLRVVMPGRHCVIHITQSIATQVHDGYIGIKDFRGPLIAMMEEEGWIYYGEVCIQKNPQVKAVRTHDRGLLFKTLASDSSHMHMALADYLLQFRKPGDNPAPIHAGISERYGNRDGWITPEEWIEWAAPVWHGIRETDVLNVAEAREEKDERHLCPLQLQVCERAIKLWSAPGEVILDPFSGIGSVGYEALKWGRQYLGMELKESYALTSVKNMQKALHMASQQAFF